MDLKMEVYSPSLELLGLLEIQNSVIWERKAFSAGSFSLQALITQESRTLLVPENIIWIAGEDAGIIEYVKEEAGENGPYITVKGGDLTGILARRILWGRYDLSGPVPELMYQLVDDCCIHPTRGEVEARVIPGLRLSDRPDGGVAIRAQRTGGELLMALTELGEAYQVPFGVRFRPEVPCMEFWARAGADRSIHQSVNEPVFYSTELDDVLSSEYSYNAQNYRNIALVAGEGEGKDRVMVTVVGKAEEQPEPPTPPTPVTKYTITLSVDPAGSGTVTGAGAYQEGQTVALTAIPADGHRFTAWQENGQTVSEDAEYTFAAAKDMVLTAVFAVIPTSRLPEGYTEVEYIQSSGTEHIDTGIVPEDYNSLCDTKTVMDVQPLSLDSYGVYFGTWKSYYNYNDKKTWFSAYLVKRESTGNFAVIDRKRSIAYSKINDITADRITVMLDGPQKKAYINEDVCAVGYDIVSQQHSICLLCENLGDKGYSYLAAKLFSCQIEQGDVLVRDFVPCIDPSGAVGLYDLVEGKFYGNAGTGAFEAGPAV